MSWLYLLIIKSLIWQQYLKRHNPTQKEPNSHYVEITHVHLKKEHQVGKWNSYYSFAPSPKISYDCYIQWNAFTNSDGIQSNKRNMY